MKGALRTGKKVKQGWESLAPTARACPVLKMLEHDQEGQCLGRIQALLLKAIAAGLQPEAQQVTPKEETVGPAHRFHLEGLERLLQGVVVCLQAGAVQK
jgi:hypothetical protein